ncbi:MAG: hypothetical protein ACYSUI_04855 [Planctomycetota bacterium]|jgi:hypothetical protein
MARSTRSQTARPLAATLRRFLPRTALSGGGLFLTGCAILGGAAATVGVAVLTGLFLGSIQATFAATARSYGYTDSGSVQALFNSPGGGVTGLARFSGRLPGFHFAIVTDRDKGIRAAQTEEVLFETDVEINFFADSSPTISGTVRRRGGAQEFTLAQLYPEITTLSQQVSEADLNGRREVTLTIVGRGPEGEQIEYTLVWQTSLTGAGHVLDGPVEVTRIYTAPGEEQLVIEGRGELDARRQTGTTDGSEHVEQENANAADEPDEDLGEANENADDAEGDDDNENSEGVDNDNAADGADEPEPDDPTRPSACIPGLPEALAGAVDLFIETGGRDALDLDGDGIVTAAEVQEAINPLIGPLFSVSSAAAECIAELLNG